jgi:ABC-type lipoprotein export system ATPase subunit
VDLCRYYRRGPQEVRAVDGFNFHLQEGEFLALVGASGSGKSTLLNLLAGLDTPTSGAIEIEGTPLRTMNRRELAAYRAHRVGMVFQAFNLIPHHTALRNVELALHFNDTPIRERRDRAAQMLERLGLSDRLDHRPGDLSGGEQQRVAIARALVKKPDILFADEPTGNLDRDNAAQIAQLMADLNVAGLTIVVATHDLVMMQPHAHRIVQMNYGKLAGESILKAPGVLP